MCLAPYPPGGMVVAFAIDFITFFYIVDKRVANKLIITLIVNGFNQITSTAPPPPNPSPVSRLRWIG
jgi:hypothetical protein